MYLIGSHGVCFLTETEQSNCGSHQQNKCSDTSLHSSLPVQNHDLNLGNCGPAKVKGHESCLCSEGSTGAKVPWNEGSTGAKVLSMVFSLPGTKVQRNEKASYRLYNSIIETSMDMSTRPAVCMSTVGRQLTRRNKSRQRRSRAARRLRPPALITGRAGYF